MEMNNILKSFTCAIMAKNNRLPDELICRIVAAHSDKGCCLAEQDMTQLISHFVMTMTTFAKTRPFFQSLSNQEQIKARSKTASLYIQYILGRYFSSESGLEQLKWLLDVQMPPEAHIQASS